MRLCDLSDDVHDDSYDREHNEEAHHTSDRARVLADRLEILLAESWGGTSGLVFDVTATSIASMFVSPCVCVA